MARSFDTLKENNRLNGCGAHAFPQMFSVFPRGWFLRYVIRSSYRGPRRSNGEPEVGYIVRQ